MGKINALVGNEQFSTAQKVDENLAGSSNHKTSPDISIIKQADEIDKEATTVIKKDEEDKKEEWWDINKYKYSQERTS